MIKSKKEMNRMAPEEEKAMQKFFEEVKKPKINVSLSMKGKD